MFELLVEGYLDLLEGLLLMSYIMSSGCCLHLLTFLGRLHSTNQIIDKVLQIAQ